MVKKLMDNPWPTKDCFMCGPESDCGAHVSFSYDDEAHEVSAEYVPERRFVGQGDILHGAIQAGLLDEAMGWLIHAETGQSAVTMNLNVDFLRPVYVQDEPIFVTCRILERQGSRVWLEAKISGRDCAVCTSARGTFHIVRPEKYEELVHAPRREAASAGS